MSDKPAPRSAASYRTSGSKRASARVRAELLNKEKGGGLPEGCVEAAPEGGKKRQRRAQRSIQNKSIRIYCKDITQMRRFFMCNNQNDLFSPSFAGSNGSGSFDNDFLSFNEFNDSNDFNDFNGMNDFNSFNNGFNNSFNNGFNNGFIPFCTPACFGEGFNRGFERGFRQGSRRRRRRCCF